MPPFTDSVVNVNSEFRRALLRKGIAIRLLTSSEYAQNMLGAPVSADQQVFVGDHPFEEGAWCAILTADLRQLGLHHAQLYSGGGWMWVSWRPAGPKTLQLWTLYLYKEFGKDRVEIKAGYNTGEFEFLDMKVGGSNTSGAQGVYAVLPYEVGMAYFPLTAPATSLLIHGPKDTYLKSGAQRSIDAAGGPASVARNHTGFRFDPKGDKLLLIEEAGYRKAPSATAHAAFFRAGYMRNSTLYANQVNGKMESGNFASYALMDYQLRKPAPLQPSHGLYLGGSAMTAPSRFDLYDRYYEARLYQEGPFRSRPDDFLAFVSSYTCNSKYFTDTLVAAGKTVWRNSASFTGTYSLRAAPGQFLSMGLSYIHGPAVTPRVADTLTFATTYNVYF